MIVDHPSVVSTKQTLKKMYATFLAGILGAEAE